MIVRNRPSNGPKLYATRRAYTTTMTTTTQLAVNTAGTANFRPWNCVCIAPCDICVFFRAFSTHMLPCENGTNFDSNLQSNHSNTVPNNQDHEIWWRRGRRGQCAHEHLQGLRPWRLQCSTTIVKIMATETTTGTTS